MRSHPAQTRTRAARMVFLVQPCLGLGWLHRRSRARTRGFFLSRWKSVAATVAMIEHHSS
jgi:hypothetical protein